MSVRCAILFVLGLVSLGLAQTNNTNLLCYDCDPVNSPEQCHQPGGNGVPQANCDQKFSTRVANSSLLCMSAYWTFTGDRVNSSGIYRGCQNQNVSVANFCDWYKEEISAQNIIMTSCVTCNSSRCNNVTFNANGQPNGSSLVQVTLTILGISVLFILFF